MWYLPRHLIFCVFGLLLLLGVALKTFLFHNWLRDLRGKEAEECRESGKGGIPDQTVVFTHGLKHEYVILIICLFCHFNGWCAVIFVATWVQPSRQGIDLLEYCRFCWCRITGRTSGNPQVFVTSLAWRLLALLKPHIPGKLLSGTARWTPDVSQNAQTSSKSTPLLVLSSLWEN